MERGVEHLAVYNVDYYVSYTEAGAEAARARGPRRSWCCFAVADLCAATVQPRRHRHDRNRRSGRAVATSSIRRSSGTTTSTTWTNGSSKMGRPTGTGWRRSTNGSSPSRRVAGSGVVTDVVSERSQDLVHDHSRRRAASRQGVVLPELDCRRS